MKPTPEQVESLANLVVESMTLEQLQQFVFDDIYSIMLEDDDCFESNLEMMKISIDDLVIDPVPLRPLELGRDDGHCRSNRGRQ
jgi:hypothetical protein